MKMKIKKLVSLMMVLITIILFITLNNYVMIKLKFNDLESEWKCKKILYPHPDYEYPLVLIEYNFRNHPFIIDGAKTRYCDFENNNCIGTFDQDSYEDYCLEWYKVKRTKPQILIDYLEEK